MKKKRPNPDNCCDVSATAKGEAQLDPAVQAAIDSMRKYEKKLLAGLAKPGRQAQFLRAPKALLDELGIPVPSAVVHHLQAIGTSAVDAVTAPSAVILPNGQRIYPRVQVRFTAGKAKG